MVIMIWDDIMDDLCYHDNITLSPMNFCSFEVGGCLRLSRGQVVGIHVARVQQLVQPYGKETNTK